MLIAFLIFLILLLLLYILALIHDLRHYSQQLRFILDSETNSELRMKTRFPYLKQITLLNNRLIRKQKESRTTLIQETRNLEKAIHNISHDLRTPLTVANGYTQILLEKSTDQQDTLSKIKNNLDVVDKHLEDLLDYQRLNEDQVKIQLEKVDLSRLVEEELVNLYDRFKQQRFQLTPEIQKNIQVISDSNALRRILQNLLGNMLKHGTSPGSLQLIQTSQGVQLIATNQMTEPIQHPEKLTERFYTEDLSRQNRNAGIGLYIVKELTQRLKGQLVITTEDESFEIRITLPNK